MLSDNLPLVLIIRVLPGDLLPLEAHELLIAYDAPVEIQGKVCKCRNAVAHRTTVSDPFFGELAWNIVILLMNITQKLTPKYFRQILRFEQIPRLFGPSQMTCFVQPCSWCVLT